MNFIPPLLSNWLRERNATEFPRLAALNYRTRLDNVEQYLGKLVHPEVEKAALLNNSGYLNDHGVEHIQTVLERATLLLASSQASFPQLTAYEVHLLVMAIHFHDVGNIFGRDRHEANAKRVMDEMSQLVADEPVERKAILSIAKAHGGRNGPSKDTISILPDTDHILGKIVRFRAIAAILRFADELADDFHRASHFMARLKVIPERSQVFHAYSKALQSVLVDPANGLVDLRFNFLRRDALDKLGKQTGTDANGKPIIERIYLLDEIYARTCKMHLEAKYCMRFMNRLTRIDAVTVRIQVFEDENSIVPCIDEIGYRLNESGYPEAAESFSNLCPDVKHSGESLKSSLLEIQSDE
jgi:hypothetical protein